jgi:hypothetical protein
MTDTTFGDFDDDDAVGIEPADPEQTARKLHVLRMARGFEIGEWDRIGEPERGDLIAIVAELLAWLRRQGSNF